MPAKKRTNAYIQALQQWNKNNNPNRWCIPKKGTSDYDDVMRLKNMIEKRK